MPVPRRFDRRLPERDQTRINDRIRVPEVRLVGDNGKQIGVVKTSEALAYAQERDLDLVEVAPDARPPVCRVLDYSKFKYEQAQKQKAARKHQQQITIREIKFRPKIAQNDYDTKKGHVERFLKGKDKVKVTIMFRGREVTHPERGAALLSKLAEELSELAVIEQNPLQEGRNMTMMLAPSKAVLATEDEHAPEVDGDDEHHGGKKVHKHDLNAEAAAVKAAASQAEVELEDEEDFDEDGEPAPITEIEPITLIEPEPEPVKKPAPQAEAAPFEEAFDVEETPGGRPASRKTKKSNNGGAAGKRAAALQAVADAEPEASAEPEAVEPAAAEKPKAKPTAKAAAPKAKPAAKAKAAEPAVEAEPAVAEEAPKKAPAKTTAAKSTTAKPRTPKSNGSAPKSSNGSNGAAAKPKAKSASKAD